MKNFIQFLFLVVSPLISCREEPHDLDRLLSVDPSSGSGQIAFLNVTIIDVDNGITLPERTADVLEALQKIGYLGGAN